ncbi:MAG: tetratricopeptide repeat protein [Pseudomonadota bacterium]
MSDFLREVDEDYRRDQLLGFWRRYGWLLLLTAGLIILGVAGYTYYQTARQTALEEQATRFMLAQQLILAEREQEGLDELDALLAGKTSPGYRALSALSRAQYLQKDGKTDAAVKAYEAIAADAGVPVSFQSLATLTAVSLTHNQRTAQEIEASLSALISGGEFQYSAEELVAAAYLREGNTEQALPFLRRIRQAEQAPTTLRARAQTLLDALDDDTLPDVTGAVIEAPATDAAAAEEDAP